MEPMLLDYDPERCTASVLAIRKGLPAHQVITSVQFEGADVHGVIWPEAVVRPRPHTLQLYREWARAHFGIAGGWYRLTSQTATDGAATQHDVNFLEHYVFRGNLQKTVIDVSCGEGRHSFALRAAGVANVIGLEPIQEPLNSARARAAILSSQGLPVPCFSDTSPEHLAAYYGTADVAVCFFNSLGYTFRSADDRRQVKSMMELLKPGGLLVLDVRSATYQRQHYGEQPVTTIEHVKDSVTGEYANMTTIKMRAKDVLGAIEHITVRGRTVQYMSYGWRLQDEEYVAAHVNAAGGELLRVVPDRYTPRGEIGERVWFIARRLG